MSVSSMKANRTGATSVLREWESEKHKSWSMPAEGFKGYVAADGSLAGHRWEVGGMWLGCRAVGF